MSDADQGLVGATELFRRHARFVARFVVRYGVALEDVDDVVQEVFLVAHAHGGYRPGPAKPTSWLAEIAVRIASSHRRRLRARAFARGDGEQIADARSDAPTPETRAIVDRDLAVLHEALQSLAPPHRLAFILFELEDEPCSSIAAATGVPVGTVHSRLHVARKRLREALDSGRAGRTGGATARAQEAPWTR
ncbi:MAG: sigma-70 family RNA polymerase sigma factor [Nannocystaceae bacterium]